MTLKYQGGLKTCERCGRLMKNRINIGVYCENCLKEKRLAKKRFMERLKISNQEESVYKLELR